MAPELIKQSKKYNEKVDVYSFGVVLYFILMKRNYPKFDIVNVVTGKSINVPSVITENSKSIIKRCLSFDAND